MSTRVTYNGRNLIKIIQSANKYAKEFCLFPHLHNSFERELLDKEILAWWSWHLRHVQCLQRQ